MRKFLKDEEVHTDSQIQEAAYHLLNHGVVAFPTETVMGVGVVYDDEYAYNRLNIIKRRPEDKPYALMLQDPDQISMFAKMSEEAKIIASTFLPGPLTLLLPANGSVPPWVTHNTGIIGVRVTSYPDTITMLTYTGKPLLAPSANRSGEAPAMSSDEVREIFGDELDFVVEGVAEGGSPSTIINLTGDHYVIVREGPITKEMIDKALEENRR